MVTQQYPDAAQTEMPYGMSLPAAGPEGLVQSAPPIGLAGFRVSAQDDVPGFNFRPTDDVPDFDPDDAVEEQETDSPSQTTPLDIEEPIQPAPPQFPNWIYKFVTMLPQLSTAFDPSMERRTAIGSLQSMPLAKRPDVQQSAFSNVPLQGTGSGIHGRAATTQMAIPLLTGGAMSSVWPRLPKDDGPYAENAQLDDPWRPEITRQPLGITSIPSPKAVAESKFVVENASTAGERQAQQQMPLHQYQQRRLPRSFAAVLDTVRPTENGNTETGRRVGAPEPKSPPVTEVYRPPKAYESPNNGNLIHAPQAMAQIEQGRMAAQMDLSSLDAGGLPTGTIISSDRTTELVLPKEANFYLVGDGDAPSDMPAYERHERGVRASIAMHIARGFEIVTDRPRAVDVPGFSTPRYYDYIIRDPVTGQNYGVEVKTTLYDTIRLDPSQVMKDAVVAAQGAKVRLVDVHLNGVSYVAYCFGCVALDFRSAVLQRILLNAGVRMRRSTLPGETRP
jgi:hypothetical protein